MPDFKFVAMKDVDVSLVRVVMYEVTEDSKGKEVISECGTNILSPEGWTSLKEKLLRTKVRCEG